MKRLIVLFVGLVMVASCASGMDPLLRKASRIPAHEAGYTLPTGSTMARPLAELIARLRSWGVSVDVVSRDEMWAPGFGVTDTARRAIQLDEALSIDARFEVLAHEGAHLFQPALVDRATAEIFADLAARGVCAFYKRDVDDRFAQYLAAYKASFATEPAMRVDIALAVRYLTGRAEPPKAGQ